ncbi:hypothetical protein CBS147311_2263 [Penicillium roqueforti]|nr:hypothetical protein CBS147311_2263 [Penicillium roqueforti]
MIASLPTPPAIATGSYGIAAVIGADDNALTKPQDLTAIAAIAVRAMNPTKPLTVGMQNGHGDVSELADIITQVIAIGAAAERLGFLTLFPKGYARISIGPELRRTAMKTFTERAEVSALLGIQTHAA